MRERKIPQKPDNVYGNRNPVEIIREDRCRILGKEREPPKQTVPSIPQPLEQVHGPSSDVPMNRYNDVPLDIEEEVAKLAQEGGVDFVNYLLAKAIPEADANKSLPTPSTPREWTFRDILRMCYEQDAEVQDRAWPQGQNMPCAPTDHPVPNLTEGWGMKPPGGAEYTARG